MINGIQIYALFRQFFGAQKQITVFWMSEFTVLKVEKGALSISLDFSLLKTSLVPKHFTQTLPCKVRLQKNP